MTHVVPRGEGGASMADIKLNRAAVAQQQEGEVFGYFHELLGPEGEGTGIWLGCNDKVAVEKAYTEDETGEDVVTLYRNPPATSAPQSPQAAPVVPEGWKLRRNSVGDIEVHAPDGSWDEYKSFTYQGERWDFVFKFLEAMISAAPSAPVETREQIEDAALEKAAAECDRLYANGRVQASYCSIAIRALKQSKPAGVEDYVKKYGFCNWQAQEVIKQRDEALAALRAFNQIQREAAMSEKNTTLTDEQIGTLWSQSWVQAIEEAGFGIGNGDVAAMNHPYIFARLLLSAAQPKEQAQASNAQDAADEQKELK